MSHHLKITWDFGFLDRSQMGWQGARADIARLGDSSSGTNYKGQLNNLLHKLLRRPVMKGDVVYELDSNSAPFTASVSLTPDGLGGSERRRFVGAACSAKKPAEQSAAARALDELEGLNIRASPAKQKIPQMFTSNYKGQLVEQLQQLLGHTLNAGDLVFNTPADAPPFVTSVEVNIMEEKKTVLSAACPNKKAAEQSAARAMVEKLQKDFSQEFKKQPICGPMVPVFCCTVSILLGDLMICEAASDSLSFSSKQAAKESAAFEACQKLCHKVEGSAGQLELSEQIARFCQERPVAAPILVQPQDGLLPRPVGLVI